MVLPPPLYSGVFAPLGLEAFHPFPPFPPSLPTLVMSLSFTIGFEFGQSVSLFCSSIPIPYLPFTTDLVSIWDPMT